MKGVLAVALGGGVGALCVQVALPFMAEHSEIILPFAASNAAASATWFAVVEGLFGLRALMGAHNPALTFMGATVRLPVVGAGIGLLTAVTSPALWPGAFRLFWSEDLRQLVFNGEEHDWIAAVYRELLIPVALPVSILAGSTSEVLLRPLIQLSERSRVVGPTALIAVYGSAVAYFVACRSDPDDYWWELRRSKLGELISVNAKTGKVAHDGGRRAETAAGKRSVFENIHLAQAAVSYLRQLLGGRGSADGFRAETAPVTVFETADMSLRTIKERAVLFALVDAMVRRKHLELEIDRAREQRRPVFELERELRETDSLIQRQFSVSSPAQLITDCELALALRRSASEGRAVPADEWDAVQRRVLSQQSGLFTTRSSVSTQARRAVDLLLANLGMLEGELQRELGYTVGARAEDPPARSAAPAKRSTFVSPLTLAAAGVGIGALVFFYTSRPN